MLQIKLLFISAVLCVFSIELISQGIVSVLDKSTNPGQVLVEFDERKFNTKGTYFIDENWNLGEIYFRSGTVVKDFLIRYDLQHDLLEIKAKDQIKVLPIRKIDGFQYFDEGSETMVRCVPCAKYKYEDGIPLTGICRVFAEGQIGLFSRYDYVYKNPDYIVALDMGTKEAEIYIKEKRLLYVNNSMYEVPLKKKRIFALFGEKEEKIRAYAQQENLNPKKILELKLIVDFVNNDLTQ